MRDCFAGEAAIKAAGKDYLPKTQGQRMEPNPKESEASYEAYKNRAVFYNYVGDTQKQMLGVMHSKPPEAIELPARIEGMKEKAAPDGAGIQRLLSRINERQIIEGRYGLLLDIADGEGADITPVIVEYPAAKILDWYAVTENAQKKLTYLLLDESGHEFDLSTKTWNLVYRYRICGLDAKGEYYSAAIDAEEFASFDLANPTGDKVKYPVLAGKKFQKIPFTFVNALDCEPEFSDSPLLSLADLCLAIYRGEADYRQALFMQGQATLFFKGFEPKNVRIGAGCFISSEQENADAKYLEVSGNGLPEMRTSQSNLHEASIRLGLAFIDQGKAESGDALGKRMAVKTASMKNIAITAADGVKRQCQFAAEWAGADPEDVDVRPNLDFDDAAVAALDLLNLWTVKLQGAPLSEQSYHAYLQKNGYTEMGYKEEKALCEEESASLGGLPQPQGQRMKEPPPEDGEEEDPQAQDGKDAKRKPEAKGQKAPLKNDAAHG